MKIYKNLNIILILLFIFSTLFGQLINNGNMSNKSIGYLTGEEYITGSDGIPRITINIWGHVKYPGTYLVYDSIDLLTALSVAGGPLKGSRLDKIKIISIDGKTKEIDLLQLMKNNSLDDINIKPNDTISIDQTAVNFIATRTNIINIFVQVVNLIIIANR